MFGDIPGDGAGSPYRGWRIRLNRLLWRGSIFAIGPAVVLLEKLAPNRGYGGRVASRAAKIMNRMIGARVEVRGLDKLGRDTSYVFVPNHRSHFDIAALIAALPGARFAAKKELFSDPGLGPPMRALGMIPIDREDPSAARRALDDAATKRGRKISVVIFPEGTRAPRGEMLGFKGGAFVFAIEAQAPIVPIALHNTANVMPAHAYLSIPGGRVVVEILDPMPTAGLVFEDRSLLKDQVRKTLLEALRPEDGGLAPRKDLGSFEGLAFGVRVKPGAEP
jgi:1-acyl-sn-glycerol-3-phosphate acyltransferase